MLRSEEELDGHVRIAFVAGRALFLLSQLINCLFFAWKGYESLFGIANHEFTDGAFALARYSGNLFE